MRRRRNSPPAPPELSEAREHRCFTRRAAGRRVRSRPRDERLHGVPVRIAEPQDHHRASKRGAAYSFVFVHPDGRQLAEIGELLKAGRIRPVIDRVFPFEQVKEALAYLEKGRARGKVVVQMR